MWGKCEEGGKGLQDKSAESSGASLRLARLFPFFLFFFLALFALGMPVISDHKSSRHLGDPKQGNDVGSHESLINQEIFAPYTNKRQTIAALSHVKFT